ncbi:MAG: proteasome subunit beta [Nitrososphaeria archaeon]
MSALPFPFPGATTIGVRSPTGAIIASEKRLSYGYFVVSKNVRKLFKVTDRTGAACAGMVADMQVLVRDAIAAVNLYKLEMKREPPVQTVGKILSNHLFGRRYYPYLAETIVGGVDDRGSHVFVLDPIGSLIEDDYAAVGTGAEVAIGVLEANYEPDLSKDQLYDLAVKTVRTSISRDTASGNGIDLMLFTSQGLERDETVGVQA